MQIEQTGSQGLQTVILGLVAARLDGDEIDLGPDTPIGADGLGFDSIACLELLLDIEAQTGLHLRSEDLTGDALATLGGLIRYCEALQRG